MTAISVLLLAAGRARRMRGADKLLELVDGVPLIRRQARVALAVTDDVAVTVPVPGDGRTEALSGLPVREVPVPDADDGMAASIRAGVAARRPGTQALMIVPGDMPELTADDLGAIVQAFDPARPDILRGAAADGRPGHPVLFPADCFAELAALDGDTGARPVLDANAARVRLVSLPEMHAITDLDTPEEWSDWRARTGH
ncbi:Purine catabolism protein PucB [Roseivivax jejudonensis]|uniref:Purine catabolism protein PucB n=1 Tax=Roseivivax jejudonensis TaxID=1529041 RepID=A0A1X6YV76_9RHOB|nr:nucleotidyltransferase family protein [Roseivivax jejudonensis]SLN31674.1 Purine catabolism protein PucB [Roseivivax jejudonensis]